MAQSLTETTVMIAFSVLPDPRKPRNQVYKFFDIISTAILATLCACDEYPLISLWTQANLEWLQSLGICSTGAPSHDTYERVFRFLDPDKFQTCFMKWTQLIAKAVRGVIAIDGKTLRGSGDTAADGDPIHMVSAFAADNELVLGQLKTSGKGKELEAFHQMLDLLDIKGATVTIDAGGCHKAIAEQIREKGGDYLLHLKGNQGGLHGEVANFFQQAIQVAPEEAGCDYWSSEEKTRGRIEKREVWACEELDWLPQLNDWADLHSIVCVRSTKTSKGRTTIQMNYHITSCRADAEALGKAVRAHWSVENKLHWHLDVTYREDASKVRKDNGPENLSVLRRATLNILKGDKETKLSLKNRRFQASWNREYLIKLLNIN